MKPPEPPHTAPDEPRDGEGHARPDTALWDALADAGPEGASVAELEAACGMGRRWVYYRLQDHATAGRAVQVRRGYWRAVRLSDAPGDDRPPPRPAPARPPRGPRRHPRPVTNSDRPGERARASRLHA